MRVEKIGGRELEFYDSVSEIPMGRFNTFNLYLMMDADIGGDMESVQRHMERLVLYVQRDEKKKLAQELENYSQNLRFIIQNISPKYLAFVALLKSIDGVQLTDTSAEGATRLLSKLQEVPYGFIQKVVDAFKKKSDQELDVMFPGLQKGSGVTEYFMLLKKRTLLVLDEVLTDADNEKQIKAIDDEMLILSPPRKYDGSNGIEAEHLRQFTDISIMLAIKANIDPKQLTAFEFYQAIETLKNGK
jgi:hypothetical protein